MSDEFGSYKRFSRDVIISALANIIRNLRNILLVPLFTGVLSLKHYGEWELVITTIAFISPWLTLGLSGAILRFLPGSSRDEVREGFFSIFFFVLFVSVAISCFLMFLLYFFDASTLAPLQRNLPAVISVLISTVLVSLVQTYFRALRFMLRHSTLMLSQHFGESILIFYLIYGGHPLSSALWAVSATRFLVMIMFMAYILDDIGFSWPKYDQLHTFLAFSIPLIPNSMFYRLYDSADRFLIFTFLGSSAVGNYAAIYLAGSLFTTIVSPIHTVLLPTMAELWNRDQRDRMVPYIEQIVRLSALITLPTLAGVAIFSEQILGFLVRQDTLPNTNHYVLICMSFTIFGFGIPLGDLLIVAGKTRQLFYLNAILAITNVLLNLLLIPIFGVGGAVFSTLFCHSIYTISAYYIAIPLIKFSIPWGLLIRVITSTVVMSAVMLLLPINIHTNILPPILIGAFSYVLLTITLGVITNRDIHFICRLFSKN